MGGLFGVVTKHDCNTELFYGTDYQSHMGASRAGIMTVAQDGRFSGSIHDISKGQFKSRFYKDYKEMKGNKGIGTISASHPQPLAVQARFSSGKETFAIATVGRVTNIDELADMLYDRGMSLANIRDDTQLNSAEVVGNLIGLEDSISKGIRSMYDKIEGSCTLLLLTREGIYAARDKYGRTSLTIARRETDWAVASESCAFPNLDFDMEKELRPGEISFIDETGPETLFEGDDSNMKICSFLWIYTGDPSSTYEGVNVEKVRYRTCAQLAEQDLDLDVDLVSGVPDSGSSHGIGYINSWVKQEWERLRQTAKEDPDKVLELLETRRPPELGQAMTKYRAGYGRSYTPPEQEERDRIAKMKLIPIGAVMSEGWKPMLNEGVRGKSIVLTEDSVVRNTQLRNVVNKLWKYGAGDIHVRVACPPLTSPCKYLHSTKKQQELATRRAIKVLEGKEIRDISEYLDPTTEKYGQMVEYIRRDLKVSSLRYLTREQVVKAIGLPKEKLCLDCWL